MVMLERHRKPIALGIVLALTPFMASCGLLGGLLPSKLTITATPTGCGSKIDNNKTVSWLIRFSVAGADAGAAVQWIFSDGTTGTGSPIVKLFDTAAKETGNVADPDEHGEVKFDVTVIAGSDTLTQQFALPMRGTLDGGADPFGDVCIPDEGRPHIQTGTNICYQSNPPASGAHTSTANVSPVAPGFYDEALATERWIHNLEHGTVVLLYDCGGPCSDDIKDQLRALFDSVPASPRFNEKKMVITRYAGISPACTETSTFPSSGQFLAIAWNVQRSFDSLDTAGILAFYSRHVDHGPEDQPIPAAP
jgi:hypothetical protein